MAEVVLDRRRFLASAAGLAVSAWQARPRAQGSPVVVIGAGMAGLRIADLLSAAGERVIVLEARTRPGGRVLTLRDGFSEGLYGEAGPIRIPEQHRRVLDLARRFDLPLVPFASGSGVPLAVVKGIRARPDEMDRIAGPLAIPAADRGLTQGELLQKYVGEPSTSLRDPGVNFDHAWESFDRATWPDWLRSRGASTGSVALMTLGGDSRGLSALYVLRQYSLIREGILFKIEGGMDRLPAAMAAMMAPKIRYGAVVTRIDPDRDRVGITHEFNGHARTMTASRVVLSVPGAVAARIATSSAELRQRLALLSAIPYFPATRFLVETARRSWHDADLSGSARTDRPAEIWDCAYEAEGAGGLLGATVGGELGRTLAARPRADAASVGGDVIRDAFPLVPMRRTTVYRWARDRWAGGAFASFGPGQMTRIMPVASRSIGRVHFAGEHTAGWMGWVEGALQSAERVVEELLT